MSENVEKVFQLAKKEIEYQDDKYGSPTIRKLTLLKYAAIALAELSEAIYDLVRDREDEGKQELMQTLTVLVQALAHHGPLPGHLENPQEKA